MWFIFIIVDLSFWLVLPVSIFVFVFIRPKKCSPHPCIPAASPSQKLHQSMISIVTLYHRWFILMKSFLGKEIANSQEILLIIFVLFIIDHIYHHQTDCDCEIALIDTIIDWNDSWGQRSCLYFHRDRFHVPTIQREILQFWSNLCNLDHQIQIITWYRLTDHFGNIIFDKLILYMDNFPSYVATIYLFRVRGNIRRPYWNWK